MSRHYEFASTMPNSEATRRHIAAKKEAPEEELRKEKHASKTDKNCDRIEDAKMRCEKL